MFPFILLLILWSMIPALIEKKTNLLLGISTLRFRKGVILMRFLGCSGT